MSANPYAPPSATLTHTVDGDCWRDGKHVVVRQGSDLPHRCWKCNAPAQPPLKPRKFYWHSPWYFLLVLLHVLIYIVVALIVRRSAALSPALCAAHAAERRRFIAVALGIATVGFAALVHAAVARSGIAGAVAAGALLVSVGVSFAKLRTLTATRIDKDVIRLSGAGPAFLASLPGPGELPARDGARAA